MTPTSPVPEESMSQETTTALPTTVGDGLPTVRIDGLTYEPALLNKADGDADFFSPMREPDLAALLAALSPEQRERVLRPFVSKPAVCGNCGRPLWSHCSVCE